jgi:hypothetical protein
MEAAGGAAAAGEASAAGPGSSSAALLPEPCPSGDDENSLAGDVAAVSPAEEATEGVPGEGGAVAAGATAGAADADAGMGGDAPGADSPGGVCGALDTGPASPGGGARALLPATAATGAAAAAVAVCTGFETARGATPALRPGGALLLPAARSAAWMRCMNSCPVMGPGDGPPAGIAAAGAPLTMERMRRPAASLWAPCWCRSAMLRTQRSQMRFRKGGQASVCDAQFPAQDMPRTAPFSGVCIKHQAQSCTPDFHSRRSVRQLPLRIPIRGSLSELRGDGKIDDVFRPSLSCGRARNEASSSPKQAHCRRVAPVEGNGPVTLEFPHSPTRLPESILPPQPTVSF